MRLAAALSVLLLLAAAAPAEPEEAPLAFVDVLPEEREPGPVFVGQAVHYQLLIGVDEPRLKAQGVPLVHQATDLPLMLRTPWGAPVEGVRRLPDRRTARGGPTLVVDDAVGSMTAAGTRERHGRTYEIYVLEAELLFERATELALPAPALRAALATRFERDALGARVPVGVRHVVIEGESRRVVVKPLPLEGRPAGFTGAVGDFEAKARLLPAAGASEASARVEVSLRGHGDLAAFAAPTADALPGLHLLGVLDRREAHARVFELEVARRPGSERVFPALAFPYFGLGPEAGYRTAGTEPLVLPPLAAAAPTGPAAPEPPDGKDETHTLSWWWILALATLLVLIGRMRRREAAEAAADERERELESLRERLTAPGADLAGAFAEHLAAPLACAPAAVISPDLAARLERAGVAAEPARAAAAAMERLVAARYGAPDPGPTPDELLALARRLEFDAPAPSREGID